MPVIIGSEQKLAEKILQLAEKKPKPPKGEVGVSGTKFFAGYISDEEYLADIESVSDSYEEYNKMRCSDGTIAAMLKAVKMPILNAQYDIDYEEDEKIRDIIQEGLLEGMSQPWPKTLKEILTMLEFGWSPLEKVWEERDGLVMPRKLAFRKQSTHKGWKTNPIDNSLEGWTQEVYVSNQYKKITIPIEKLILFIFEQEGDNYQGKSILRSARKHYRMKLLGEKAGAIGVQRWGVGMPNLESFDARAQALTEKELDDLYKSLRGLSTHDRAYFVSPLGWRLRLLTPEGTMPATMLQNYCTYHKNEIISSILADFLLLGKTAQGSRALSDPQLRFFLGSVNAVAEQVCETLNRYLIKPWVDYNWTVKTYPKLTVSGIEATDLKEMSEIIKNLYDAKAIRMDDRLYAFFRDKFDFTEEEPETRVEFPTPQPALPNLPKPAPDKAEKTKEFREPTEFERNILALDEIRDGVQDYEEKVLDVILPIQEQQKEQLARDMANRPLNQIATVKVRKIDNMTEEVLKVLKEAYRFGRQQVKNELQKTLGESKKLAEFINPKIHTEEEARKALKGSAYILSKSLADRLYNSATAEARRMVAWEKKKIEQSIIKHLNELSVGIMTVQISKSINAAFNQGRQVEAYATEGWDTATGSSLLDSNICMHCLNDIDGQTWKKGEEPSLPYERCQGYENCRCIMIYS